VYAAACSIHTPACTTVDQAVLQLTTCAQ